MTISAALLMAPGFEEMEAITCLDILRRASIPIVSIGLHRGPIVASRQTQHIADLLIEDHLQTTWDLLVLPGGAEGVANLMKEESVQKLVLRHFNEGKWIAAICAAPMMLAELGILDGRGFTCHPTVQNRIAVNGLKSSQRVVVSGRLITSLAAGSSVEFAYEIIRQLLGEQTVLSVDQGVCFKNCEEASFI